MVDSSRIAAFSSACVLAVGLGGCASGPQLPSRPAVNTPANTTYVQANPNPIKISRCEDNGILVVDGSDPYNLDQFYRANPWSRNPVASGITSERMMTREGLKLMFYANPVQQSGSGAGTLLGVGGGAAAGHALGGGRTGPTLIGALLGAAFAPVINGAINGMTSQFKRVSVTEIAECREDLKVMYGGAGRPQLTPQMVAPYNGPRPVYSPYDIGK